jgi:hypothetical protein
VLTQTTQRLARVHPRRRLNDWLQRLDDLQGSLLRCVKQGARQQRAAWRLPSNPRWRAWPSPSPRRPGGSSARASPFARAGMPRPNRRQGKQGTPRGIRSESVSWISRRGSGRCLPR